MRDKRFVAVGRGGSLRVEHHHQLAAWAADCAAHVLRLFIASSADDRPQRGVEAARAWAAGALSVGDARTAALDAHAAARTAAGDAAAAAARAAGHAAATAHMADHCLGAAAYALKAVAAAGISSANERIWQDQNLSAGIRELVLSARRTRP
jgi:hypothetical protein